MRLARGMSVLPLVAALSWGCSQEPAGPSVPGELSAAKADLQDDFDYIAQPPSVRASPSVASPNALPFCNTSIGVLTCYSPGFLHKAYNFPPNLDGTGETILIVDAFGSPTIQQDLALFDQVFGIPAPPSFSTFCPERCPDFDPSDTLHDELGWSLETSLDVEYAHAMAPGASIVLVVARNSSAKAINVAEAAAVERHLGSVMSQSFGIPEILVHGNNAHTKQAGRIFAAALRSGITVLASAGDFGATNGFQTANASFPASHPLVTAVGGTQGNPYSSGLTALGANNVPLGYGGEQVWNEPQFMAATGGAPSLLFPVPFYQYGLGLRARGTPDVAYDGAINGGVLVLDQTLGGLFVVGGTSAGSPQWAAIVALANQLNDGPLGFINPTLYKIGCSAKYGTDFHDITVGNNRLAGTPVGFDAGTGWDGATGWGTPDVAHLVQDLATPPSCPRDRGEHPDLLRRQFPQQ